MAHTFNHTVRRYVGEKLYQAEYLNRKHAQVNDDGTDPDKVTFAFGTMDSLAIMQVDAWTAEDEARYEAAGGFDPFEDDGY